MTSAKPKFIPEPRIWNLNQLAQWFGRGLQWLRDRLPRLEAAGFPPHDDLLGGRDADACKMWLDARSRLLAPDQRQLDDQWDEALK